MTARTAGRVAWTAWIVAVVAIAAGAALSVKYPFTSAQETYNPISEAVWAASWLGFGLVGALIVRQRPHNRIGWLLVAITFTLGMGVMSPVYGRIAFANPAANLPFEPVATWLATWIVTVTFGCVVALLLVFPTAQLASRRSRILAAMLGAVVLADATVAALTPGAPEGEAPPFNPLGVESLRDELAQASGMTGSLFALVAALVLLDFVVRFRRSRGVERQQFKWMVLAAATFPPLFIAGVSLEDALLTSDGFDPVAVVFFLCGNGLAAAIGVAVTRHGLYEINRVVSRTVAYALLTAVLVGVYLAAVTLLTSVTAPFIGQSPLAVAAATLIAAAVFGPARRRIQAAVDRRFNRARYDAARTVDSYRGRLRDEVDLESVASDLVATVLSSMQPTRTHLWLTAGGTLPEKTFGSAPAVTVSERHREKKVT